VFLRAYISRVEIRGNRFKVQRLGKGGKGFEWISPRFWLGTRPRGKELYGSHGAVKTRGKTLGSRFAAVRNADIRYARGLSLQKLANAEARHSAALLRKYQLEAEIESLTHELASLRAADIPNLERSVALVLQLHELAIPKACADAQQQTSPQHCGRQEGSFTPPISPKQSSCSGGNTPSSSA
jgi:hypothetical protein